MLELLPVAAVLLLPGFALAVATNNHQGRSLADVLGLSFGLSLVGLPLLLLLAYATFRTVSVVHLSLILVASAVVILFRVKSLREVRIGKEDVIALLVLALTAGIIGLFNSLSPIFPLSYSADFLLHLALSDEFLQGRADLSSVSYPPGVHFLIGAGVLLVGLEPFVAMQRIMAVVATLAPLLIYSTVYGVLHHRGTALVAALLYLPAGMWWYGLFISGLYSNFYGSLVSLSVFLLLVEYVGGPSKLRMGLLFLGGLALYLSHFTIVIFLVALWVMIPLAFFLARSRFKFLVRGLIILTIPGAIVAAIRPDALSLILSIPGGSSVGGGITGAPRTALASFLGGVSPFLQFLYFLQSEAFPFLALALVFATPLLVLKQRLSFWVFFFYVWFFAVWATAPSTGLAWRSAYYALLPLILVFAVGLKSIDSAVGQMKIKRVVRRHGVGVLKSTAPPRLLRNLVLVALIGVIFASSLLPLQLSDAFRNSEGFRQQNEGVYDAVKWIRSNTLPNASLLAVGDWRLSYAEHLTGRAVPFYTFVPPDNVTSLATAGGHRFVIVSRTVVNERDGSVLNLYELYKAADGFTVVWENPAVVVFAFKA
ncbi:MAG: hypothetical protein FJ358_07090 [Thaumarchaeota archaeon]|nr:hypothetical protein [Nitrososphaerota archaeon]